MKKRTLLLFAPFLSLTESILLDIHLLFRRDCMYSKFLETNLLLRQTFPDEQVDFFSKHTPHITLYLADFDVDVNGTLIDEKIKLFLDAVQGALKNSSDIDSCRVDLEEAAAVKGFYAMYPVPNTDCLQFLSDRVVNATLQFINRPPSIPNWIKRLPEKEKQMMIKRVEKYGSPNVFDGFHPHVTVGYDEVSCLQYRKSILRSYYSPEPCFGPVTTAAVAMVSTGGTVLQDGQLLEVPLKNDHAFTILSERKKG